MKFAFLILVHRYPLQAIQLIELLLKCEEAVCVIHVDLKSPEVYTAIQQHFSENKRVLLVEERYKVFWGSYGQIRATASLLKTAYRNFSFDYCLLLSGQDMPVKKFSELKHFFTSNKGKQYLVNFKLPDNQWSNGGLERMQIFYINTEFALPFFNKLNALILKLQRSFHFYRSVNYNLYGGSNWFNLSSDAVAYIISFLEKDPAYLKSFRWTRTADEIFIQTILLNSSFKDSVVSNDLRYVDWSSGPEYPRTLRVSDFGKIVNAKDRFFARKFDLTVDSQIIKSLSQHVGS